MIDLSEIKIVHVEASSRCNSRCSMCSRYTQEGYLQDGLLETDLSDIAFYKLFTKKFCSQLEHVYFSGVYGDPCLNKNLPSLIKFLLDNQVKSISVDTNAGYRSPDWWAKLAQDRLLINFAIDGLRDALALYRINVNYDKVIENVKAFVEAGGKGQWNFIVFKHNENQIEEARSIAQSLGLDFRIKVTQKFKGRRNHKVMIDGEFKYLLEPPENQSYRHPNVGTTDHFPVKITNLNLDTQKKLNGRRISCKIQKRSEVYLTSTGMLMPCCYLGTYQHDSPGSIQFKRNYSLDLFDLNKNSVEEILENFKMISSKWNQSIEDGNLITCLHTCGDKENTTLYYDKNRNKENILNVL